MSRFCEIVFCAPLLYRRHVCSSNLKHSPSRELPLTARKTVFSHLKYTKFKPLQKPTTISVSTWSIIISQITTIENNGSFEGWKDKLVDYSCDRLEDENMYEHYIVVLGHFVKKVLEKIEGLRAVFCKDRLRVCKIEKSDFPKLCQREGLDELFLKI